MSGTEANATEVKSPSFGDVLKTVTSKSSEPAPAPAETKVEAETPPPAEPQVVEATKPVETPAAVATQETARAAPSAPTMPGLGFVPIAVAQAERAKRQELEAKLKEYESGSYTPVESAPPAPAEDLGNLERKLRVDLSEQMARKAYSDYDEKVNAFASEVYDLQTGQIKNQALWDSIQASPLPAEAAYKAGIQILEAQKLGGWDVVSDPVKYRAALAKQISGDLEKSLRAKIEAEFAEKAGKKANTITDISSARSASGAAQAAYESPSLSSILRGVQKRR